MRNNAVLSRGAVEYEGSSSYLRPLLRHIPACAGTDQLRTAGERRAESAADGLRTYRDIEPKLT